MSPQVHTGEVAIPGQLVGVGVDIVRRGRVDDRLAKRMFSPQEQEQFQGNLELPFAAREAVVKAVGGPGIPGAPLQDMVIHPEHGPEHRVALSFHPQPAYRQVLLEYHISSIVLSVLQIDMEFDVVVAFACPGGKAQTVSFAWVKLMHHEADQTALHPDEIAFVKSQPIPQQSLTTRCAARLAARALLGEKAPIVIRGGGQTRPYLQGAQGALVSLAHEQHCAVALVAIASRAALVPIAPCWSCVLYEKTWAVFT